ncbi:Hypothetical predicted protein [Mytilus galloprovincialis]|uniref:Ig-like domain-containing protein n=1 Tax=Mytilus galloprovincialis TaxID=29158 RepID=A0A8B6H6Z4_MYTGA|nr:Hypothetical predicted protein [Mytilus galloprovincialis]
MSSAVLPETDALCILLSDILRRQQFDAPKMIVLGGNGKLSVKVTKNLYNVQINGIVDLKCSITGHPNPRLVYWIKVKDGKHTLVRPPTQLPDYSPTKPNGHFLKIEDAVDQDGGLYKCIAVINDSEIQSEEIHLSVLGD